MDTLQMQMISTGGALLCAGIGSIHDVRARRVPNRLTAPAIVAGLALHTFADGTRGLRDSAIAGLIAGSLSLVFWIAGGLGGGDVKLMTAVGCLAGCFPLRLILISIALSGAVSAIAYSLYHGRLRETLSNVGALLRHHRRKGLEPHPVLNLGNPNTLRMPFALPIAAGCLLAMCTLAFEAQS